MQYIWLILPAFLALLCIRALLLNRKPPEDASGKGALHPLDVLERLAVLIRCKTVSHVDYDRFPMEEFHRLNQALPEQFPDVFKVLEDLSLSPLARIFLWKGQDPELDPVLFLSHNDVVPAPPEGWEVPPFEGIIKDGFLYGRGTQDIKVQTGAMMEAVQELLNEGSQPRRSIYFAFGGDEEVSGREGAQKISSWFREQGFRFHFIMDEGGVITRGQLDAFTRKPVALLGVEEKGRVSYTLEYRGEGGHASMPPKATSIGLLVQKLAPLVRKKYPSRIPVSVRRMLEAMVPYAGWSKKILLANLWIFGPLFRWIFSKNPTTNSIIRTTRTLTLISGGTRVNVLPPEAKASFNIAILPGDTILSVEEGLEKSLKGTGIKLFREKGLTSVDPVVIDKMDSQVFDLVAGKVRKVFPDTAAVPFLFNAITDSKSYKDLTSQIIRFTPLEATAEDLKGIHGVNERVSLENYSGAIHFYKALFQEL